MVNMHALKSGKMKPADDAYDTGIGTQFSAETNKRDEDEEMMKWVLNFTKSFRLLHLLDFFTDILTSIFEREKD